MLRRFPAHRTDDSRRHRDEPLGAEIAARTPYHFRRLASQPGDRPDPQRGFRRHRGSPPGREDAGRNSPKIGVGQHARPRAGLLVQARWAHCPESGPARRSSGFPARARLRLDRFRRIRTRQRRTQAALCHQHRLPVCLQLLHGYGVLQSPLQSLRHRDRWSTSWQLWCANIA